MSKTKTRGFTIVELLIVIVVIAILAAISVVAYTGIQQRSKNAAIVDVAAKSMRAIQAYIAANNSYPLAVTANACITIDSGCVTGGTTVASSATFNTAMGTISTLPRSVPDVATDNRGIYFAYNSGVTFQGVSRPTFLVYFLTGANQNCGSSNVVQYTWPDFSLSTTGNSGNVSASVTRCWVTIPGPGV